MNELDQEKIKSERAVKFEEEFSRFKLLHEQGSFSLKGEGQLKSIEKEPSEEGEVGRSDQDDLSLSEDDSTQEINFTSSDEEENKEHSRHRKEKKRILFTDDRQEPLRLQHLNKAQLTRDQLEQWCEELFFDDVTKGAYARVCARASSEKSQQIYKVGEIVSRTSQYKLGYERVEKPYKIKTKTSNKMLLLGFGKQQRLFKITFVSNSGFQMSEFDEWIRSFKEIAKDPPLSFQFEKKADQIKQYKNYEYTLLETELKIANNLLENLRMMPPQILAQKLNLQQLTDATRVKITQFKREQDRADRMSNMKAKAKKEYAQRKELITKNKEIMERLTELKEKLVELEEAPDNQPVQTSQSKTKNELEKFCTSKNISVEEIERAASFLPIRNFFKEQRNSQEEDATQKEINDFQILDEFKESSHISELNEVLRGKKKEFEEVTKLIRPRYLNAEKFKRRQKQLQKEENSKRKAMKAFTLEEYLQKKH